MKKSKRLFILNVSLIVMIIVGFVTVPILSYGYVSPTGEIIEEIEDVDVSMDIDSELEVRRAKLQKTEREIRTEVIETYGWWIYRWIIKPFIDSFFDSLYAHLDKAGTMASEAGDLTAGAPDSDIDQEMAMADEVPEVTTIPRVPEYGKGEWCLYPTDNYENDFCPCYCDELVEMRVPWEDLYEQYISEEDSARKIAADLKAYKERNEGHWLLGQPYFQDLFELSSELFNTIGEIYEQLSYAPKLFVDYYNECETGCMVGEEEAEVAE